MEFLHINMLGDFSLQMGEHIISDNDNRSKKGWMLLAYLIYRKGRIVAQKELIKLLWGEEPASSNPEMPCALPFTVCGPSWISCGKMPGAI